MRRNGFLLASYSRHKNQFLRDESPFLMKMQTRSLIILGHSLKQFDRLRLNHYE